MTYLNRLQNTRGYKMSKSFKIIISICIALVFLGVVFFVVYSRFFRSDASGSAVLKQTQTETEDKENEKPKTSKSNSISTSATTTTTIATDSEINEIKKEKPTEILIITENGKVYAEHSNEESKIYFTDDKKNIEVLPETVEFEGSSLIINTDIQRVELDSSLITILISKFEAVNNNPDFSFSASWKNKFDQIKLKNDQINEIPGIEIEELPDSYPAAYSHASINIFSVDKNTFDNKEDAEKYALEQLATMATDNNVTGYFVSRGLLNNKEVKHLIYWIK